MTEEILEHIVEDALSTLKLKIKSKVYSILKAWEKESYLTYDKDFFFFPWGSFFLHHHKSFTQEDVDLFLKEVYPVVKKNQLKYSIDGDFSNPFIGQGYYDVPGRDRFWFTEAPIHWLSGGLKKFREQTIYQFRQHSDRLEICDGSGNPANLPGWNPFLEERVQKLTMRDFIEACTRILLEKEKRISNTLWLNDKYFLYHTGDVLCSDPKDRYSAMCYREGLVYNFREDLFIKDGYICENADEIIDLIRDLVPIIASASPEYFLKFNADKNLGFSKKIEAQKALESKIRAEKLHNTLTEIQAFSEVL